MIELHRPASWENLLPKIGYEFRKRSSGVLVGLCVFHNERTPSLFFWPISGRYHCFGCGADGNQKEFFSKMTNMTDEEINHMLLFSHVSPDQTAFDF